MSTSGNTATNVTAGTPKKIGAIYMAPLGSTLPTDASTDLDAAFECLGYISEDGVTNSNSPDATTIHAWGGDPVLVTYGEKTDTFQFSMMEVLKPLVLQLVYNTDNVTGDMTTGITVNANNDPPESHSFVIDMIMRDDLLKRIVIPSGSVTELGDVTYNGTDAVVYETTIAAMRDDAGNTHYEYLKGATA